MEELVKFIVDQITGEDSAVSLTKGEVQSVIEIKVSQEKIGQVVGRGGRVIKAIRNLVTAKAGKENLSGSWRVEVNSIN